MFIYFQANLSDDQDLPPRILANEVNMNRLKASRSPHSNPESGSFIKDLEYLHKILIKPVLEDPTINTLHNHQTIVFIPCKVTFQNHSEE